MHKQVNLQLRLTLSIQGWQCWDGFAHPGLAWWVSLSKGTSLVPLSNSSRVPQDFREHYSSQRMFNDAPAAPVCTSGSELQP